MINIENLHFSYAKSPILKGVNLEFKAGNTYGLFGKNGTGKSTLLHAICGLLYPQKGNIEVLGHSSKQRKSEFLQNLFIIPEEFFFPNVSIKKFVQSNAPFYPNFNNEAFGNYIEQFAVPTGRSIQKMSYGQKKKVFISFAIACNTPILIMDEPTNGLDIESKSTFRKILAGVIDEHKCIIISTHQVQDLEALIDYITIIDEGEILFNQSVATITDRLSFRLAFNSQEVAEAIYSEPTLGGYKVLSPSAQHALYEGEKMDIELLYKAVRSTPGSFTNLFN